MTEENIKPLFIMLCGVPYSGKSTAVDLIRAQSNTSNPVVLSTDAIIENIAKRTGETYGDIFHDTIKAAEKQMYHELEIALNNKERLIIWDQTNLDSKTRRKKLQKIPSDYVKFAFVFDTPSDETLNERIEQRKDKVIPRNILDGMISRFESPTEAEGFDVIIYVGEKKDTNNE